MGNKLQGIRDALVFECTDATDGNYREPMVLVRASDVNKITDAIHDLDQILAANRQPVQAATPCWRYCEACGQHEPVRSRQQRLEREISNRQVLLDSWQPIETAPKRLATSLLLYDKDWSDEEPVIGSWDFIGECWVPTDSENGETLNPSHWKLLDIPKTDIEDGETK